MGGLAFLNEAHFLPGMLLLPETAKGPAHE